MPVFQRLMVVLDASRQRTRDQGGCVEQPNYLEDRVPHNGGQGRVCLESRGFYRETLLIAVSSDKLMDTNSY